MKALTVLQPWASLIACDAKKIETRSWATKYRGPIAIHAGKAWTMCRREITYRDPFHSALWPNMTKEELMLNGYGRSCLLPVGAVIATADLIDCPMIQIINAEKIESATAARLANFEWVTGAEFAFGDYTPGRYAWILANVRRIDPVPAKGKQRLWDWEEERC